MELMNLSKIEVESIRKVFKRKNSLSISNINFIGNDDEVRRTIKSFEEKALQDKKIKEALIGFNPDVHVIVTKEQLDITNQLKALTGIASKVNVISEYVDSVKALNVKVKTQRKSKIGLSKEEEMAKLKMYLTQPKKRF